jgi:hypothetical protein
LAVGNKLKKNHDKLLQQLTEKYPVLTVTTANRYIQQLRQVSTYGSTYPAFLISEPLLFLLLYWYVTRLLSSTVFTI